MEKDPPLQNPDPQGWGTQTRFSELGRGHAPYNLDDLLYLTEGEAAARDGDGAAKFFGGFDPFMDDDFDVCESFLVGLSVGGATGKFGDFSDKRFVGLTPSNRW